MSTPHTHTPHARVLAAALDHGPTDRLTADKTAAIARSFGGRVAGFVVVLPSGAVGVVQESATRWFSAAAWRDVFWEMPALPEPPSTSAPGMAPNTLP